VIFRPDLVCDLAPFHAGFPFRALLQEWLRVGLNAAACRAVAERWVDERRLAPDALRLQAFSDDGPIATERVLHPPAGPWQLTLSGLPDDVRARPRYKFRMDLAGEEIAAAAELIRDGCALDDPREFVATYEELGDALLSAIVADVARPERTCRIDQPGVYRLPHACLAIRSATTTLLVDPISSFARLPHLKQAVSRIRGGAVDAIFITHGHADHWHLPSLLRVTPNPETPVFVPAVPRPSLLTLDDFGTQLREMGQAFRICPWDTSVKVGDIDIDVLPFYGEQPTRDGPGAPADIRNWGNCYRFHCDQFSVVVLADSGADPAGDMRAVLERSRQQRGPVDALCSSVREFASPFFGGLPEYWAPLTFGRLRELYSQYSSGTLPSTTAGPAGIAEACVISGARQFLPYANGFAGMGAAIDDVGWGAQEPSEAAALAKVAERLRALGGTTECVAWITGEQAYFRRREMSHFAFDYDND
jgi:L-ascorbate metabolism protein UlaG (beta-lactamase superfamily)